MIKQKEKRRKMAGNKKEYRDVPVLRKLPEFRKTVDLTMEGIANANA